MKNPLVSVNIRTLNSGQTLTDTLLSVKSQTYLHIEVIISDGYSSDNTVEIAKKFGAKINYAKKLGDARYKNYINSKGKYIFSLDSDQILDKKVIQTCVELCEKKGIDAVIISEKSVLKEGTLVEKLIAFDKWVIDQNRDSSTLFGTMFPRFFRRKLFDDLDWPKGLAVFDDIILYDKLLKKRPKVKYIPSPSIWHHEVTSWGTYIKKWYRYGKGYFDAFKGAPFTVTTHSFPRRIYFSKVAFSRPHYFLGLLLLYFVKISAAGAGVISYFIESSIKK